MVKFGAKLRTDGTGYWSDVSKTITCTGLTVPYINDEEDFGELRVYFDTSTWNTDQDGLIYTDQLWLRELKLELAAAGFNPADVDYSEQGMQGDDYVSLDVEGVFIRSWLDIVTV